MNKEINYHQLSHDLLGTCKSVQEWLDQNEFDELDELQVSIKMEEECNIYLCVQCGWWVECGDLSEKETDEHTCKECIPDDED